jgi:phosphopantetheinyl transferase (holo-ACP synthase)
MRVLPLPESWRDRALVVTGVTDPQRWFSAQELAMVNSFARPKRRMEWMLSRIAEKELRRRGGRGNHVSFSHSAGYGAAAVDERPVGIDVETLREIAEAAAHLFLTDAEVGIMRRCSIAHRLLHFWSAKEAVWKQRAGAVATLKRVPIIFLEEGEYGLRFDGVETWAVDDVILALTITLPTS